MSGCRARWIGFLVLCLGLCCPGLGWTDPPIGVALTKQISLKATPPSLNRRTGDYQAKLALANRSRPRQTVYGPLSIVLLAANRPGVSLAQPDGLSSLGPYVWVHPPGEKLEPRGKLKNIVLRFTNPRRKKFKARYAVYGLLSPNHPPLAEAGPDRTVFVGDRVAIDGSGSTDADGNPLTFRWKLIDRPSGSLAALSGELGLKSGFTVDLPGTYRVQLVANDRIADSAPDIVTFSTENSRPVAHAGPDQTAPVGALVNLDGSGSGDLDRDPLSYLWSLQTPADSQAALAGADTAYPSFTLDRQGHYTARLIVNDGKADSDPDTVEIDTRNSRPVANAGPDRSGLIIGQIVTLDGRDSTDVDRDPLSFHWSVSKPDGSAAALSNPNAQACTFTPDLAGDYLAQLIVSDGRLDSIPDTATLTVAPVNPPPRQNQVPHIASTAPTGATVGQAWVYTVTATDPDNDTLSYTLTQAPMGMTIGAGTGVVQWTPGAAQTGLNNVRVTVSDGRGGADTQDFTLTVSGLPPPAQPLVPALTGLSRAAAETAIEDAQLTVGTLTFQHHAAAADGIVLSQSLAAGSPAAPGTAISLTVSLGPDNGLPPNPATVAPPVDPTVATTVIESTKFLYSGPYAIQRLSNGQPLAAGTIEPKRVAVVRGKVLSKDNQPLPGVLITIKDHPELGQTLSRADGMFDLAVNGGGYLTVNYEKGGYLPAQRQVDVPWQDFAPRIRDVVLIPADPKVSSIDLSSPEPFQVASSTLVTDSDGQRQVNVFFPQGTQAELLMPDGSTQPLSTLHVRITEFTVGDNGPLAMPADLPPTTAYTFAVDYGVDEATAVGAKHVKFSQPVIAYVDNFLGFDVGVAVPSGDYDRDMGAWVGSESGKVIKITAITNGLAELDTDGDGTADNNSALGITDAERAKLAEIYTAGKTLWRVRHSQFSDYNWAPIPQYPADAKDPDPIPPIVISPKNPNCKSSGSIIECENQVLGETIPITGTAFTLNYRSDRVVGNTDSRTIRVPLSGRTSPQTLQAIVLKIEIAGQSFTQNFPPVPEQETNWVWDGRDAYGRILRGAHKAKVKVGYRYPMRYAQMISQGWGRAGSGGAGGGAGVIALRAPSMANVTFVREYEVTLFVQDERDQGLGGWSITPYHHFDSFAKLMYLGNGERQSIEWTDRIVSTLAGNGSIQEALLYCGSIAAKDSYFFPVDIAVAPDGSYYVATGRVVFKVDTNGTMRRVAGNGFFTGTCAVPANFDDGIPAELATFGSISSLALGPDGSLYVADSGRFRVRRIGLDGLISTVAGSGVDGYSGDDGPATAASLTPDEINVAEDGTLYISDQGRRLIRRAGTDGIISTIYNSMANLVNRISGLAVGKKGDVFFILSRNWNESTYLMRIDFTGTESVYWSRYEYACGYNEVATDKAGNIYIGQTCGAWNRGVSTGIYRIDAETHQLTGIAGYRNSASAGTMPAQQTAFSTSIRLSIGPDGSLYVADRPSLNATFTGYTNAHFVKVVTPALPGFSAQGINLSSEDGSEVYNFDSYGKHLQTLNGFTGATEYQFTYDANGRLETITDGNGNVTSIEHDALGNPTAIVAPFGQRTTLSVDADGYLASATNSAGETTNLTYSSGGLLASLTDPRGNTHAYEFNSDGRLLLDQDPEGGSQTLARSVLYEPDPNKLFKKIGHKVNLTTALGRSTGFQIEDQDSGQQKRTIRLPDGTENTTLLSAGSRSSTFADGTTTALTLGADPRFGLTAPTFQSYSTTTGGLTLTASETRSADWITINNQLHLKTLTTNFVRNGRISNQVFDALANVFTDKGPANRQTQTVIDTLGRVTESRVTGLESVKNTYDPKGRLASVTQGIGADQRSLAFTYNPQGYLAQVTDPLGRSVGYEYDLAGRVTRQTLPDGNEIAFAYDPNGNLTSLTPPGRPAHAFTYNPVDQQSQYIPPDVGAGSNKTTYAYNLDKQLTQIGRPDGLNLNFTYDAAGRLSRLSTPDGDLTYGYDPTTGKLTGITTPAGDGLGYGYAGALLTSTTWTGAVTGSVGFAYDNDFRVREITLNGADPISYQYDADSLLIQAGSLTLSRSAQNGLLTGSTLGGLTDSLSYNGFGEISQYAAAYNGSEQIRFAYTRDKLGRITQKQETQGGATDTYDYAYDLADRLAEVKKNGATTARYTYDANGNRLKYEGAFIAEGTYDAQDRLLTYGGASYEYTANGELAKKTLGAAVTTYQYDVLGNLKHAGLPGGDQIDYLVDGQNRRIGKKVNGVLKQAFLWQDQLKPIAELDGSGNLLARFIYATRVNVPDYMVEAGVTYRIITDHLGSPRLVVRISDGFVAQRMEYDEFGNVLADSNPGFQPFGFAGGLYDRDTGLVRFGARDYDAGTGRWLEKDPIGFAGEVPNLFGYAMNSPINLIDVFGTEPKNLLTEGWTTGKTWGEYGGIYGGTFGFYLGGFVGSGYGAAIGVPLGATFGFVYGATAAYYENLENEPKPPPVINPPTRLYFTAAKPKKSFSCPIKPERRSGP